MFRASNILNQLKGFLKIERHMQKTQSHASGNKNRMEEEAFIEREMYNHRCGLSSRDENLEYDRWNLNESTSLMLLVRLS